ncbi:hypothetical protein VYU27_004105 [Nannochloropsis oceanica]
MNRAFYPRPRVGGLSISSSSPTLPRSSSTQLRSDVFFNFEGLKRRLNLTHFSNPDLEPPPSLAPLQEEDYINRPDLVKAREIAKALNTELTAPGNYPSVALYFHVAAHHLQSFREALQDFIQAQQHREKNGDVFWEAFQLIGLPAELEYTPYPGSQAGRVPSRSRVCLCGTFATQQAEERAKHDVMRWRSTLKSRLAAYRLLGEDENDPVETMPMSQAVYRRIRPKGPPTQPRTSTTHPVTPSSVFLLAFLQASWSSERKIRLHLERLTRYMAEVTDPDPFLGGPAERTELYIDPSYPSAHRVWHQFPNQAAMVKCLSGPYVEFLGEGAKFRARVNHVEQAFAPLVGSGIEGEGKGKGELFPPTLSVVLSSCGSYMPLVGYGTSVYRGREREGELPLGEAMRIALRAGCRLLDCSPNYGTQKEVGEVLCQVFEAHETTRERVFIVSSLSWEVVVQTGGDRDEIKADVRKTFQELNVEYLDLLLLPYVVGSDDENERHASLWRAMEALVEEGLVRHLGVGGFPLESLKALQSDPTIACQPVVCQLEHHPFYRDETLVEYCEENGIQLLAHTPLGRPALSRPPGSNPLREPLVEMSATALECSPAQVVLRWAVQQGVAVVPNSLSRSHILENSNLHTFTLAPFRVDVLRDMAAIRNLRFADPMITATASGRMMTPPYSLEDVRRHGLVYGDDGAIIPPGSAYKYMELTVEVFERLDLGDMAELLLEPRTIDGTFPGMDVEPIEEGE